MSRSGESGRALQRFLGGCMMAAGGLIATLCGLCTVLSEAAMMVSAFAGGRWENLAALSTSFTVPLLVGGLPTAAGVALFIAGRRMVRGKRAGTPGPKVLDDTFS